MTNESSNEKIEPYDLHVLDSLRLEVSRGKISRIEELTEGKVTYWSNVLGHAPIWSDVMECICTTTLEVGRYVVTVEDKKKQIETTPYTFRTI
jgi:hypothetical protein